MRYCHAVIVVVFDVNAVLAHHDLIVALLLINSFTSVSNFQVPQYNFGSCTRNGVYRLVRKSSSQKRGWNHNVSIPLCHNSTQGMLFARDEDEVVLAVVGEVGVVAC